MLLRRGPAVAHPNLNHKQAQPKDPVTGVHKVVVYVLASQAAQVEALPLVHNIRSQ